MQCLRSVRHTPGPATVGYSRPDGYPLPAPFVVEAPNVAATNHLRPAVRT